jgi:hypothetical protein
MKSFKLFMILVLAAGTVLATTTATELFIPAAARATGAAGTDWKHDARLYNPNAVAATVTLTYEPRATYAGDRASVTVTLAAGKIEVYENVLDSLFGITTNTAGAIHITSNQPIAAETRIYNAAKVAEGLGTYGQRVPGIPKDQAIKAGSGTDLIYIDNTTDFRTNLGLMDASGAGSTAVLSAFDGVGAAVGTPLTVTLGNYEPKQYDGVLAQLGVSGSAANYRVFVSVTTGSVIPYASQVDNVSGDPIYLDGAVCQGGGGPAGCMTTGAYYGYCAFDDVDYDWLVSPFAPTLVDGKLEGFAILGTDHLGIDYVWPVFWTDVYFDPPLDLTLTPNVPFEVEFSITFTYVGLPDDCVTATYTLGGIWDGCSKINDGTIEATWVVVPGAGCKDVKDIQGKFQYTWEAGIDPSMGPVSSMGKRLPLKRPPALRIR